jgi:hypothetical protein
MMNESTVLVPLVTAAQATTPSKDLPPPSDASMPSPTAEQATLSDRVFTTPDHATALLGILSSAMLLRDIAADTFDTSNEEDEVPAKPDPDPDADNVK